MGTKRACAFLAFSFAALAGVASGLFSCTWKPLGDNSGGLGPITTPYCEPETTGCPGAQNAFHCQGHGEPSGPYEVDCHTIPDPDPTPGDAIYCCTYVPHCWTVDSCGDAGEHFECNDPLVPQGTDPSLECATVFSASGATDYCCAHRSACFPADLFGCGDAGQSYACTGDAAPPPYGLACGPGAYADAGTSGTYCCNVVDSGSD